MSSINYDFLTNNEKYIQLIEVNKKLKINTLDNKKIIFVYTGPKVGSTSLVSSLRIFGLEKF
mgnify:CR=1 FL=1